MNSKMIQSALLVIIIAAGICGWQSYNFYSGEYQRNEQKTRQLLAELEKVKEARRIWEEALKRGQGQANYNVRFNYLTEQGISMKEIGPIVLKKLNNWLQNHQLKFASLDIHAPQKAHSMDKYSFTLHASGHFKDIDATMRWAEEELRAVITNFSISSSSSGKKHKKVDWKNLNFNLTWYWLEGAPKRLHSVVQIPQMVPVIKRNPFKPYRPKVKREEATKHPQGIVWRPAPSLQLQGIMVVGNGYKAIINGQYLREGMSVGGYRVLSIGKDQVIVARGNIRSRLKLKLFK